MNLEKTLSHSDAKYKIFPLSKMLTDAFPEKEVDFTCKFMGKKHILHVNNRDWIMLTKLYSQHEFKEGETVTFKKIKDKEYEISVN